jgi:hypothetical protein
MNEDHEAILKHALAVAQGVESCVDRLGLEWRGAAPILAACRDFRHSCERIASNRGYVDIATIAFVGPKNAGKSQMVRLLINDPVVRERIPTGPSNADATVKPLWIASEYPACFDREEEDFIPCHESQRVDLGRTYALVDVPGLDERSDSRSERARKALDFAVIKVLIVSNLGMESDDFLKYIGRTNGCPILPVVNLLRVADKVTDSDYENYIRKLKKAVPSSKILPLLKVEDWDTMADAGSKKECHDKAASGIADALRPILSSGLGDGMAAPWLAAKSVAFRDVVASLAKEHLPQTAAALNYLEEDAAKLPGQAMESFLKSDRSILAKVRVLLLDCMVERTSGLLFPWRTFLRIGTWFRGSLDRVPFAMIGSLPSLFSMAWHAGKNLKDAGEAREQVISGFRNLMGKSVLELSKSRLTSVSYALRNDLGGDNREVTVSESASVSLTGIESLQHHSEQLYEKVINEGACSRLEVNLWGWIGFFGFWAVFGWPVYGLFKDFYTGVARLLIGADKTINLLPSATSSMLFTSLCLAIVPIGGVLVLALNRAITRRRVEKCVSDLRRRHKELIENLINHREIQVEISEPRIDCCRRLLGHIEH